MNAQELIEKLRPLEGHYIAAIYEGGVVAQVCKAVLHLEPDQRKATDCNVILWDGRLDAAGFYVGLTFSAQKVQYAFWHCHGIGILGDLLYLLTSGTLYRFYRLEPIE